MKTKKRLAYIGYKVQEKYLQGIVHNEYDELLCFLQDKGLCVEPVIWNDERVDWGQYDFAILKSPWDYHENVPAFYDWLNKLQACQVRLLNSASIVQWNMDKHYLQDITAAGLSVIATRFLTQGSKAGDIYPCFELFGTDRLILKPCISAGAMNTLLLTREKIAARSEEIDGLLAAAAYLVQPFEEAVLKGEWSFLFFNGVYSHSVLKVPGKDDFRVQHYHGGSIEHREATARHIKTAGRYVHQFAPGTLYARVDGIVKEDEFYLMELELIEPYLYLSDRQRLQRYYDALTALLKDSD